MIGDRGEYDNQGYRLRGHLQLTAIRLTAAPYCRNSAVPALQENFSLARPSFQVARLS